MVISLIISISWFSYCLFEPYMNKKKLPKHYFFINDVKYSLLHALS